MRTYGMLWNTSEGPHGSIAEILIARTASVTLNRLSEIDLTDLRNYRSNKVKKSLIHSLITLIFFHSISSSLIYRRLIFISTYSVLF